MIVLEGREKPASVSDNYIQSVLADINRFARARRVPILFVIPTIEEQVARIWCDHGVRIGDLIPEQKLYDGSRWYNFPGVSRTEYIDVVEETVRTLNPPYNLYDFGISPVAVRDWVNTAPTIGRFIEILAGRISAIKGATTTTVTGKRTHVWIVYCSPDLRHYDHTYLVVKGLCQDDELRLAPTRLFAPGNEADLATHWKKEAEWAKLVAAINFLDVRLINFPITTVVTAALAYGTDKLIDSFKTATLEAYKPRIARDMPGADVDWSQPLAERKLQTQNARESMERTNLFRLLRNMAAEPQKGGNAESPNMVAQYWHLIDNAHPQHLHYYVGSAIKDLMMHNQFQGFLGVATETPVVEGQNHPVPDISVYTESAIYALEFHFTKRQATPSEIARYAVRNVVEKYMRGIPYLSSQLETIFK
ncbi:MAG: hypothetical protein U0822_28490 [Anaerolineae bacterium]